MIDGIGDVQKPESRSTLLNVAFEQQRLAREMQVEISDLRGAPARGTRPLWDRVQTSGVQSRELQVENEFDELEAEEHTPVSSSESAVHPSGPESQTDGVQPRKAGNASRKLGIRQFARVDELGGHGFSNAPG